MPYVTQLSLLRNLLYGVLHFGFTILWKKWAKKEEENGDTFLRKKTRKTKRATISVDGKGQFFQ